MGVVIPDTFSNPVVLVVPNQSLLVATAHRGVDIYYAVISENEPVSIENLAEKMIHVTGSMHVRGEATALLPKKQYSVKLSDEPASGNFLGMPGGGKHWVFNDCGAVDFTLMRNVLAFTMQRALGQYAPEHKFFELFICDKDFKLSDIDKTTLLTYYEGLYLNFDKIRFQGSRIDLPYDKKNLTSDYAIIQLNQSSDKYLSLAPRPPLTGNVEIYEPKLKNMSKTLQSGFSGWYINQSLTTGWAGNFASLYSTYVIPKKTIPDKLFANIRSSTDYPSFAAYFLLNEIAKDPDGYHKSTFMVKNKNVCYAGPFWDKNKSYGNVASCSGYTNGYVKPENWLFSIKGQSPCWWHVLIRDPQFQTAIKNCWDMIMLLLSINFKQPNWIDSLIDDNVTHLTNSGALTRNNAKWPNNFNTSSSAYMAQIDQLKTYLNNRITWIENHLDSMLSAYAGGNSRD